MVTVNSEKMYKIVDAYEKHFGEKKKQAIEIEGKFLMLIQGAGFQFVYDFDNMIGIHSSVVMDSEIKEDNKLYVYTLNTVYVFEEVTTSER